MKSFWRNGWVVVLACAQAASGLLLLALSAWFIAACALAQPGFNYMLPAVGVRALALLRISSGYAQLWFGHRFMLQRVAELREQLFRRLAQRYLLMPTDAIEALAVDTEVIAARWVNWVSRQAGALLALLIMLGLCIRLLPTSLIYQVLVAGWACALFGALLWQQFKRAVALQRARLEFRVEVDAHLAAAPLWHMQAALQPPSATAIWRQHQRQLLSVERYLIGLQWGSVLVLLWLLRMQGAAMTGSALWLVPVLLLLNLRDWLAPAFLSTPAMADDRRAQRQLARLPAISVPQLPALGVGVLALQDCMPSRFTGALPEQGVVALMGASGAGKTLLLKTFCGLHSSQSKRVFNGVTLAPGIPADCVYLEQQPYLLSDTLRENLCLGQAFADQDLLRVLKQTQLIHLSNLDEWLGVAGRPLSGGELKRLEVARALLRGARYWFVDEPFEGLDSANQQAQAELFNALGRDRVVLIATHILPSALQPQEIMRLPSA